MREIKFRGKRLDNGEWVCGDLHLNTPYPHIHFGFDGRAKIDTNTIGQFTGKNMKVFQKLSKTFNLREVFFPNK